jgi:transketolase
MQEGIQAEAASIAGHLGLGRLVAFYDDNHISIEGNTQVSFSEDVGGRYEAYGWHVQHLGEDISLDRVTEAFEAAKAVEDRPSLIIARTHIAPGSPNKQDTGEAHGSPLGEEEIKLTKEAYGWPSQEPFFIPDGVLEHYREAVQDGEQACEEWKRRFEEYREAFPDEAAEFERLMERRLPDGWDADVPRKDSDDGALATRKASSQVIQWAAKAVPELVGGSADLAPSTLTLIDGADSVERGSYGGRNLHFGIREHGMGAVVNGLTLSGLRGYGATFLIFSDYMKASIRLAAVMGVPSIFVFTHDSIGLGEDGPTHQPIEQLAALRATPNVCMVRPADFNETALAWKFALSRQDGPTCFALSRQGVGTFDAADVPDDAIERGAYVLRDCEGEPDVILIGTGSEVHTALQAADQLSDVAVRVVSMPCMDTFEIQDQAYRDSVLPPSVRARVAVEAAAEFGWSRWADAFVGMHGFGASGPYKAVYEHFGITPEAVVERARAALERG